MKEDKKKIYFELQEQLTEALSGILFGKKIPVNFVNNETGEIIIQSNRKITKTLLRKLAENYDRIEIDPSPLRKEIDDIMDTFRKRFDDLQISRDDLSVDKTSLEDSLNKTKLEKVLDSVPKENRLESMKLAFRIAELKERIDKRRKREEELQREKLTKPAGERNQTDQKGSKS